MCIGFEGTLGDLQLVVFLAYLKIWKYGNNANGKWVKQAKHVLFCRQSETLNHPENMMDLKWNCHYTGLVENWYVYGYGSRNLRL